MQIECQLGYLVMLISDGICHYDGKSANLNKNILYIIYTNFWDRDRARFPEKNYKAQEHIQMIQCYALHFFRETRSVTVPRFEFFFQDSRIRVKCLTSKSTEDFETVPTQYFRKFIKYEKMA